MENQILQEILAEIKGLKQGQGDIIKRLDGLEKGQEKITRQLDVITNSVDTLSNYIKKHDEIGRAYV